MEKWIYRTLLILGLGFTIVAPAYGEEQRCKDLGASCICSEPLNTNVLPKAGDAWQNPADSTVKECTNLNQSMPGYALERPNQDLFGANDSLVLSRLPQGHQIRYYVRPPNNHLGMFSIGHYPGAPSEFEKRIAARWYIYRSDDFEFANDGTCHNAKFAQFGGGALLDSSFGYVHMYNFVNWSVKRDCCMVGPGPDNLDKQDWRGKWYRAEIVFSNISGPGFNAEVFLKNVTDNLPEIKVVDLKYTTSEWTPDGGLTPPSRMDQIAVNAFRSLGANTVGECLGWQGFSHYMFAGWTTDAGQRIGPAYEIEGGAMSSPSPSPTPAPVTDSTAPSVTITAPVNGATVKVKSTVTISANAQDDVAMGKVEFYVNGALKCTDTSAPYACAWRVPQKAGRTYQIQAKAFDLSGNPASSTTVTVSSIR
jgi:hypothetical protein